ncbi:MAG: caspase family protein [Betaproteobacteria bacterium]|nr:caspase family protein [Betaproteobacteria bacterium]
MREPNRVRRRILQAGVAAGSLLALPRLGPGQSQSPLNTLPRFALVIGNSKYAEAPLRNPGNDAKAISGELMQFGFKAELQIDAGRAQMADAIQAFSNELAKSKGVGLFYYAGHGAQLAWRNYLIPVDAAIDRLEDLRDKTVELNSLLQGLVKARNPMNVIILDACRDNPFGTKVPTEQKGLSQFDAPHGSLLAYATSPGTAATDGEGANGLYTENLLREIKVPEAKIEDVFKRVRLNVRLKSEGQQIPWESTSLEEDFYFQPPRQTKALSEEELEKQFEEELAIWDQIKGAKEPAPIENYLRRYPSGKFSELAQFRLNRLRAQREAAVRIAVANNILRPSLSDVAEFKYEKAASAGR